MCVCRRQARYGPIFKTSLVGHPVVVSADEELNHMVFQQEGQLFQSWYPDSFVEILGRDNVGEQQGAMFKYLKNMVLRYFGPESLRESTMLRDVEGAVTSSLCTWSTLPAVELKEAVSTVRQRHTNTVCEKRSFRFVLRTDDMRVCRLDLHADGV